MILNILTRRDEFVENLIAHQQSDPEAPVEIFDLTEPNPDYRLLLEKIFKADHVHMW